MDRIKYYMRLHALKSVSYELVHGTKYSENHWFWGKTWLLDLYQNLMYAYDTNNIHFIWKRGLIVILTNNVSIKIPIFPMKVSK